MRPQVMHQSIHSRDHRDARAADVVGLPARQHHDALDRCVDEAAAREIALHAGLVVARKSGRVKLHYLNPVPIRLIHDRWIDKYTEPHVSALADLKKELENER